MHWTQRLVLEADELAWKARGGIDLMEGVLHLVNKQWRTYYVLGAGNVEINGTEPSGEIGT